MSLVEPIVDLQWGKADWQDYVNNWREKDAEYLQSRVLLRYRTGALRDSDWPTPSLGQMVYNEASLEVSPGVFVDRPEMYSKQHNAWVPLLMLANITSTKDDSAGVALSHRLGGGKGVIIEPTRTQFDNPVWIMGGVLGVDATGVSVKTGGKTAKLTTSATDLVSDSPLTVPTLTAASVVATGTLSAPTISGVTTLTTANINMSGTLTGGVLSGSSGTIGGVQMGTAGAHGAGGVRADAQGFHAQFGAFYGDGAGAFLRQRNSSSGAYGAAYVNVTGTEITLNATYIHAHGSLRCMSGRSMVYHNPANTVAWNGGPVIYGGDPGVGNVPEGTVWVQ